MRKAISIHVGFDLKSVNPCRVTIWYEDATAHARALEVCQDVAQQVDPQLSFDFTGWRLEDLDQPAPAYQAIQAAAGADIVLISTNGASLPAKTKECLEACAKTRTKPEGALAWLVGNPADGPVSAEKLSLDLRQTASRLGMDFLPPGIFRLSGQTSGPSPAIDIAALAALKEQEPPGYDHWGLNE